MARAKFIAPGPERAARIRAEVPAFEHHTTATPDPTPARGACSPETRASPATSFTRVALPKVCPSSRLTAAYTSVDPGALAAQVTTTSRPEAARETPVFVAPSTAKRIGSATGSGTGRAADAPPSMSKAQRAARTLPPKRSTARSVSEREAQAELRG